MPRIDSTVTTLVVAAVLAGAVGLGVHEWTSARTRAAAVEDAAATAGAAKAAVAPPTAQQEQAKANWIASAPGRVEPRGGEVRVSAQASGRVVNVVVSLNDEVKAGDLMFVLDDEDAVARVTAAEAEVAVRQRERDGEDAGNKLATERRGAEDKVAVAERGVSAARAALDRAIIARRGGTGNDADVDKARTGVREAKAKLEAARANYRTVAATAGMPLPLRGESSLTTARADLTLAETALERTRVRAPIDGTVLQLPVKVGETVVPSPEAPQVVLGDLSGLRVRAEIEERDIRKVRAGQQVVVRSDAFPGQEFQGKITTLSRSLGGPRLANRGPRRPTDVDVLEGLIDIDGRPPLLPGMRVDIFIKPDATVQSGANAATN